MNSLLSKRVKSTLYSSLFYDKVSFLKVGHDIFHPRKKARRTQYFITHILEPQSPNIVNRSKDYRINMKLLCII